MVACAALRDLFPHIPSQSRFNRRRRALMDAFNLIRQVVLSTLDLSADGQAAIDSVPVVKFHLVPGSTGDWAAHGAEVDHYPFSFKVER